jgi:L-aminopeptidase/D-esterase-like protein
MSAATANPRARDIGIPLEGETGPHNNISDVAGVEVGYSTLIMGQPADYVSDESLFARTGVTAILPRGKARTTVVAGRHSLNGYGEMTGIHYLDDFGQLDGPVMLTNTLSVGTVRDAAYKWFMRNDLIDELFLFGEPVKGATLMYPVVAETYDGFINNARGFHITEEHAFEALESAASGPIAEGNVGGGTGMQCHLFKGGSGSSSRVLTEEDGGYTLGVFVQANHGFRERFMIKGIPVGKLITGCDPVLNGIAPGGGLSPKPGTGSIIAIVATDAPLTSRQISMLCKRVTIGIGVLGGGTEIDSGDIFLGFSTAHTSEMLRDPATVRQRECLPSEMLNPLFSAVVDATEEAILNAMVAAETMVGINGNTLFALPHDQVRVILKDHGRLVS